MLTRRTVGIVRANSPILDSVSMEKILSACYAIRYSVISAIDISQWACRGLHRGHLILVDTNASFGTFPTRLHALLARVKGLWLILATFPKLTLWMPHKSAEATNSSIAGRLLREIQQHGTAKGRKMPSCAGNIDEAARAFNSKSINCQHSRTK